MSVPYLLEGRLRCRRCQALRQPTPGADGRRFYACVPGSCVQRPTEADWVEQHAILAAIVHMDGVLRHGARWRARATAAERAVWERVDVSDKLCLLTTAFTLVEIGPDGKIGFLWASHDDPQVAC